ncbi:hypothetical protein AD928_02425 [Acetobacter cerevisiae]|uniref:Uncharacterized protein n=1 Tax=Acetobacter cerevisiae TaxID=178900 RepID=A0A149QPD4_9PROT|nr:hypothetical protein AD928_02425 [Acetobacter cerevisiae]GBQ08488.1 hypothetical protein AA14362_1861 [Acetobacter cerevisiae DSM 14362]
MRAGHNDAGLFLLSGTDAIAAPAEQNCAHLNRLTYLGEAARRERKALLARLLRGVFPRLIKKIKKSENLA